jgi:hypothetical protein
MTNDKKDLKVIYSSECTESYQSDEQFGSWSAEYYFRVHSFTTSVPGDPNWDWVWETDVDATNDVIPEAMHCVWVRYSDGDSFGRSTGNGQIVGLFKDEDAAHKLAKSISDNTYKPSGQGYKTWCGYFNDLESVEVEKIPQENSKYPKSYTRKY